MICHSSPRNSKVLAQDKTSQQSRKITKRGVALKRNGWDMCKEGAYNVIGQADAIWEQGRQVEEVKLLMLNKCGC